MNTANQRKELWIEEQRRQKFSEELASQRETPRINKSFRSRSPPLYKRVPVMLEKRK
jgi:hypothetical protein